MYWTFRIFGSGGVPCVCGIVLDGWYSGDELVDVGIVRG